MTNGEAINWLINISADVGKAEHRDLWHYEQALMEIREMLESAQPDFSCKGCQTPKHICGICMRNYPNITDHYTGGEAG